jgi:Ca2+/Na+ antiporter
MESNRVVDRADSFGRALGLLGAAIAVVGVLAGLVAAIAAHQTQSGLDQQSLSPALARLGELGAVLLGGGSVVIGVVISWAGSVLRTLAAIYGRLPEPRMAAAAIAQPIANPVPEMPIPAFGQGFQA